MISKEYEKRRSRDWRILMTLSSLLIVLIALFFLIKMFRGNPLEGTWSSQESDLILSVKGNSVLTATIPEALEGDDLKLKLDYTIDKDEKTISIKLNDAAMQKAINNSDGRVTEDTVKEALGVILTTFDYSIDQDEMTLTEREYGDQMVFIQK